VPFALKNVVGSKELKKAFSSGEVVLKTPGNSLIKLLNIEDPTEMDKKVLQRLFH